MNMKQRQNESNCPALLNTPHPPLITSLCKAWGQGWGEGQHSHFWATRILQHALSSWEGELFRRGNWGHRKQGKNPTQRNQVCWYIDTQIKQTWLKINNCWISIVGIWIFTVLFFQLFCIFGIFYNKMLEGKKKGQALNLLFFMGRTSGEGRRQDNWDSKTERKD